MSGSASQPYNIGRRWIPGGLKQALTTSIVAYGSYHLISWAWNEWNNSTSTRHDEDFHGVVNDPLMRRRRRRKRMQQQQRQVCGAFTDFLPQLRSIILNPYTNLTKAKQSLKRIRHANAAQARANCSGDDNTDNRQINSEGNDFTEEMELWEEMKVKVLLGMLGTAYCQVLLYLLLHIQCHLLLSQPSTNQNEMKEEFRNRCRKLVLSRSMSHFFEKSIPRILLYVQSIIEQNTTHWNVMKGTELSLSQMHHTIQLIEEKLSINFDNEEDQRSIPLISFLIPTEENEPIINDCSVEEEERAQYILNLTWDMLESPTFAQALQDSLSTTMDLLHRFGYSPIFYKSLENNIDVDDHEVEEILPLVNVLTQIKKTAMPTFYDKNINEKNNQATALKNEWTIISSMLDIDTEQQHHENNQPNIYISEMVNIPSVLELGDACMME